MEESVNFFEGLINTNKIGIISVKNTGDYFDEEKNKNVSLLQSRLLSTGVYRIA